MYYGIVQVETWTSTSCHEKIARSVLGRVIMSMICLFSDRHFMAINVHLVPVRTICGGNSESSDLAFCFVSWRSDTIGHDQTRGSNYHVPKGYRALYRDGIML